MEEHIRFDGRQLVLLDQRLLPNEEVFVHVTTSKQAAAAITDMVVRGAPAIGITAAYGMALAALGGEDMALAAAVLGKARPTAVNLSWALKRMASVPTEAMVDEAVAIHRQDIEICKALGAVGAELLPANATLVTHCNAGALATGGWGTALGVVRSAALSGGVKQVFIGETRPYLQGARLTAWELLHSKIPVTLLTDNAMAHLFSTTPIDAVVVGTDRVAKNGDTANKIGTLALAIFAKRAGVPFYIAMPTSTLDLDCPTGEQIPIEERSAQEVLGFANQRWAADVPVYNPAFDVTPAELITGWITENGLWKPAV